MRYEREYLMQNRLTKDMVHKKLSGVCGGIARHYQLSRLGVRIAAVVSLFAFPVVTGVAYIVAAMLLPARR
ncbi:PspC domain-containing protein [Thalassotalea sp. G2M2-11]|uniref:PspC domain-containing protein n=1 Tax=Thalassotalea sp. G2M2-11 TaxID=2787627 RepID=UPI0019D2EB2C|nr:PspC domain-containing protein [Thalassotalea sp. G2M2-11]